MSTAIAESETKAMVIGNGHELVEIAKVLLAVAEVWEKAEALRHNVKIEARPRNGNGQQGRSLSITLENDHEDLGELAEKMGELVSIGEGLIALLQSNRKAKREIEVTISII